MTSPSPDPDLAQALGQALVTFDAIRHLSRRHEDRSPDLFAAFMSAAVAALAVTSQDRRACHDAAAAARQIHQLLASADDAHAR